MDTTSHKMASSSSTAVMADLIPSSKINNHESLAASSAEELAAAARVASGSLTRREKRSPKRRVKNAKPAAASHSKAKRWRRSHSVGTRDKSDMNDRTEDSDDDNERVGVVPEVAQSSTVCVENDVVDLSCEFSNDDDSDDDYILEKAKRNVLPADQTELWIARLNYGQCPKCGIQTHTIDGGSRLPITDQDVRKGRCLLCNPLPASHSRSSPLPNIVPPSSSKPTSASVTRSASTAPNARSDRTAAMNPTPVDPAPKTPLAPLTPSRASGKRFVDTFVYGSGSGEYTGEIDASGNRHGRGIMKYDSGDSCMEYVGEWKCNKRHEGKFIRRLDDCRVIIQLYQNGSRIGKLTVKEHGA